MNQTIVIKSGRPTVRARLAAAGVAALAAGGMLTIQSPASASSTYGPVIINCGIVTCSAYLSRSATKAANQKLTLGAGGYAAAAGVMCTPLTVPPMTPVGVACGAIATVHGAWIAQEIGEAATQHGARGACLKMTFTHPFQGLSTITYWSTNNGSYCKN